MIISARRPWKPFRFGLTPTRNRLPAPGSGSPSQRGLPCARRDTTGSPFRDGRACAGLAGPAVRAGTGHREGPPQNHPHKNGPLPAAAGPVAQGGHRQRAGNGLEQGLSAPTDRPATQTTFTFRCKRPGDVPGGRQQNAKLLLESAGRREACLRAFVPSLRSSTTGALPRWSMLKHFMH